jgi:quinone-modifying oxidoreductase, subunit QmoB
MDKKTAVFICTGCGIGEALDVDKLSEVATEDGGASGCRMHPFLCGAEGVELIRQTVNEGTKSVVIAACSPRVNYDVFDFGRGTIVERANIREQVVWCHPPQEEDTQMMAEDCIRMACAKIDKTEEPTPFIPEEQFSKDILVIGGGLAGMTASLEAAKAGYRVVLVEKESGLGGFLAKMKARVTQPYKEVTATGAAELIHEVESNERIQVYTSASVALIEGAPGLFNVHIESAGSEHVERVGAIVQATGWVPYDASKLGALGYGKSKDVVTNVEFETMAASGKIVRPSDGKEAKNVLFIQCAGSRDPEHLPYCSSVCCLVSLKQAAYLKEQNPESVSYILYKDMRTLGQAEDFYRKTQLDGNVFIRGSAEAVGEAGGKMFVEASDELLGEKIKLEDLDLVVLAVGLVPASRPEHVTRIKAPEGAENIDENGMIEVAPDSGFYARSALNLQYRQGPELPTLKYGFPDSHFICFPYETRRTGIYTAGCLRRPMETANVTEDATGAAMKAVQCVEAVSAGFSLHPRSGDLSYPEINFQRCTQCKRCTEECPFGAFNEDEKANPLPNPTRCRRCGVCLGACPERVISFKNYSVGMIGNMIKAIHVPEEDEEKPRVLVFVCENDAYPALDMAGIKRMQFSPYVRFVTVRCLGSLNLIWIADALSRGIDGVLLFGCRHGDDYQCHFIKGSELAETRLSKISETLDRLALESERVRFVEIGITDYFKIPGIINEFMETIEEVGPNPFKGW